MCVCVCWAAGWLHGGAVRACVDVQVYKVSIGAACGLSWPSDRIIVQVLDDSTDPVVKVHTQHKELQHAYYHVHVSINS